MNRDRLWGIDLGGTKIEGAILSTAESPNVLYRKRIPTEAFRGYEHIVGQIAKMFRLMTEFAGTKPDRIGIATPGTLDPQLGVMKNCNTTALNGKPLKADLERALETEVQLANDANCFALAETRLGVVRQQFPDARVVFGVIMGTGVGGGLVVNGATIFSMLQADTVIVARKVVLKRCFPDRRSRRFTNRKREEKKQCRRSLPTQNQTPLRTKPFSA